MARMPEHMDAIFSDLERAAEREDLIGRLRTADLPEDRKPEQFAKLKTLKPSEHGALKLIDGRFIGRFKSDEQTKLCVHTDGLNEFERTELEGFLDSYGVIPDVLDESTLLFLTLQLRGLVRIKRKFMSRSAAANIVEIADEPDYTGHEIDEVIRWFEEISIYSISSDSVFEKCNSWYISSRLATAASAYRVQYFPESLVGRFSELNIMENVSPKNAYYAITSLHWQQSFLEIYRCLETIFCLPWVIRLKMEHNYTTDGLTLARQLRSSVGWRQREKDSVQELFTLVDEDVVQSDSLMKTKPFLDIKKEEAHPRILGKRIYKVRNILVHQEDYEDHDPIMISDACWPVIIDYLISIVTNLYRKHSVDANFSHSVGIQEDAEIEQEAVSGRVGAPDV